MLKPFFEALKDGFYHIRDITDKKTLDTMRTDGILVDDEGYYSYSFGDHKEYELCVEPMDDKKSDDSMYCIALYKNRVLLTQKLPIWIKQKNSQTG